MKRWPIALALLAAAFPALAGWQSRDSNYNQNVASGSFTPGCTESNTWLTRLGSAPLYGLSSTTLRNAYDTMICGMVTDGDFAKLDVLYIFATDNITFAKMNLISTSFTATYSGVPAEATQFTAGTGYTGNAANVFLDSGFNPTSGTPNYNPNSSGSIGVYIPAAGARSSNQNWPAIGVCNASCASQFHDIFPRFTDTFAYVQFSGNVSSSPTAMANAKGLTAGIRTSATAQALWKFDGTNSGSIASNASATGTMSSFSFYIFSRNAAGTANGFSGDLLSAAFIGGGTIGVANVAGRINTFMTSLGINAY